MPPSLFTALPNDVLDAYSAGDLTLCQFLILCFLHRRADWATGKVARVSALMICSWMDQAYELRTIQKNLKQLIESGWLTVNHVKGSRTNYSATLNNYRALTGTLKDQVLNTCEVTDWRELEETEGAEEGLIEGPVEGPIEGPEKATLQHISTSSTSTSIEKPKKQAAAPAKDSYLCKHKHQRATCKACKALAGEEDTTPVQEAAAVGTPTSVSDVVPRKDWIKRGFPWNLAGVEGIDDEEFQQTREYIWGRKYDGTFHCKDNYWRSGPNAVRNLASMQRTWDKLRELVPDGWTPSPPPRKADPFCGECWGTGCVRGGNKDGDDCTCAGPAPEGSEPGGILPDDTAWQVKGGREKLEAAIERVRNERKKQEELTNLYQSM